MADTYQVRLSAEALSDIQHIYEYVSQDSPRSAAELTERLSETIDSLETMPARFKQVGRSRSRGSPVHSVVVQPYIVYYRVEQDARLVTVMTLRHGRRKQPRRFA